MKVRAKLNFLRISPRKVRAVIDLIRKKSVLEAESQLNFSAKRAAQPILKLINSAVANAENNFKLKKEDLYIKEITANEGPKLKRWKPRAFGRATPILKRSSHITLVLEDRAKSKTISKKGKPGKDKKEEIKVLKPEEIKQGSIREDKRKKIEKASRRPFGKFKSFKDKFLTRTGKK